MVKPICFALALTVIVMSCLAPTSEAVLSQELMLSVRPILKQCAVENQVSEAELAAIIANDLSNNTRNTQCLAHCFMGRLGMFDEAGNINVDVTKALFSKGENAAFVNEVVDACKDFKGADACQTAGMVYACYVHKKLL